jgi:general secretion pathway protein C
MARLRRQETLIELSLLALCVWLAAVGVSTGIEIALDAGETPAPAVTAAPRPPEPEPVDAYAVIATADLFGSRPDEPREPTSELRLWGVGFDGDDGWAVIEANDSGEQGLYRIGDDVGGARVAEIHWDHVLVRRGDRRMRVPLESERRGQSAPPLPPATSPAGPATPSIRRTSDDAFIVDRGQLVGAVDNMSGLLTQLRAVPEVEDGRPIGFRLFEIADESVFRDLGLRDGDVVQRVNGTVLADPASLLGFLQRLRDEPRVALDIVRSGTPRTLVYDLR